jgi:hypothetical protein
MIQLTTLKLEARGRVGLGSFNYRTTSAVVSGPLVGQELTGRFAIDWQGINEQHPNLKNATDQRVLLSNGYGLVAPDAPRTFALTLRYRMGAL